MSYELPALGDIPLILRTQNAAVRRPVSIPTHEWTPETLEALRSTSANVSAASADVAETVAQTPSSTEGLPLWIRARTAMIRLAGNPLVWVAAGGLAIFVLFGRRMHKNPGIRIEYDPLDAGLGDVYLGDTMIGGVTSLSPGGRRRWQPVDDRGMPMPGEYSNADKAAAVVQEAWIAKQSKPKPPKSVPKPLGEPGLLGVLDITVPEWVKDVEVEAVAGTASRYVVRFGDDRAGFIDQRGRNWDAYVLVKGDRKQIEIGTTRKRAITSIYVAARVLGFLEESCDLGQVRSYSPRRFKTVKSKIFGEAPRRVEEFQRTKYYNVISDTEISGATKIPIEEVRTIGKKLAEARAIYGIVTRKSIGTFTRVEELEERPDQRDEPWGPSSPILRRRRVVAKPDIKKLRKSPVLTPEEKKKLPVVRSKHAYSFAIIGPRGAIGFYEAD